MFWHCDTGICAHEYTMLWFACVYIEWIRAIFNMKIFCSCIFMEIQGAEPEAHTGSQVGRGLLFFTYLLFFSTFLWRARQSETFGCFSFKFMVGYLPFITYFWIRWLPQVLVWSGIFWPFDVMNISGKTEMFQTNLSCSLSFSIPQIFSVPAGHPHFCVAFGFCLVQHWDPPRISISSTLPCSDFTIISIWPNWRWKTLQAGPALSEYG